MMPTFKGQPVFAIPQGGAMIDTDERRAVVRRLTDALYEYLTLDVTEIERAVNAAQSMGPISAATFAPTDEMLIEASNQVNELQERIDTARAAINSMPLAQLPETKGMADMLLVTMVSPMENELKSKQEWLTRLQAEMKKART